MSWTTARLASAGDTARAGVTHIAWSTNGTSEAHTIMPRTAITLGAAAVANPSIVANSAAATTAAALGPGTLTHWAWATSGTGGAADLVTTWNLTTPGSLTVATGQTINIAIGQMSERMHQTATAP